MLPIRCSTRKKVLGSYDHSVKKYRRKPEKKPIITDFPLNHCGKSKTIGGTIKNVFGEDIFKKEIIMCKKSFKIWYLIPSTQDLHRNQIYKNFF